jgi:hypothetical protein
MSTANQPAFTKTFEQAGTFQAFYAAQQWLTKRGYSFGSTCRDQPTGILKGDFIIAKWRNLTQQEIEQLDGRMTGDTREGPVTITLMEAPAQEAA